MTNALVAPILIPLLTGGALLLAPDRAIVQRAISLLSCIAVLAIAILLLRESTTAIETYRLGNWSPPFGIVLVLDRLSALMLLTNAVLAFLVSCYACAGDDRAGRFFHPLFQFQLVGINGAFLTGDLFNLFVFFEILLIASYGLLLHGSSKPPTGASKGVGAGVHYVVLNLIGSALFLFAAGIFYGIAGTLNFADLARFIAVLSQNAELRLSIQPLLAMATLLLLLVFGLKAAFVPLHFWLPRSYSAAIASVAALFAIMSKIGIYALLRMQTLLLGSGSALHDLLTPWLHPIGVATMVVGALGMLASTVLVELIAYTVIISIGTLTLALALNSVASTTALLYYLPHSTLISAGMFLLAAQIDRRMANGASGTTYHRRLYGVLFLCGAMALIGVPPLSGFIGKLLLLQSTPETARGWIWTSVLLSSFAALIAFSRLGTLIFWKTPADASTDTDTTMPSIVAVGATAVLLLFGIAMSIGAASIVDTLSAAAQQLFGPQRYIHAVLQEPLR